jgi:hypothetical protein
MRGMKPFRRGLLPGALPLAGALLLTTACAPATTPRDAATPPIPATAATPESSPPLPAFLADTVAAIRADYAPDRRVARFDVEAAWAGERLEVTDATDQPAALARLERALAAHGVAWAGRVRQLPDTAAGFETLRPGDLLFFGRPATATSPERVIHVGMWIGDSRFIHSSSRVQINSVDPQDPLYDAFNAGRYLRTKRMLGDAPGVHRLADDALYPIQGRFAPTATSGPAAR